MMTNSNDIITTTSIGASRRELINKFHFVNEKKFTALNEIIKESFNETQEKYKKIQEVVSPVVQKEFLWGMIKSTNIEKSLEGLLEIIKTLSSCTLDAFQANSNNLQAILELMKITVEIENDLYKQLEVSDCSKENISNLLHDLCAQYNIDNQTVEGLFEQSFNRTFTLRNRINDLREEVFERITGYEKKYDSLDEYIHTRESDLGKRLEAKIAEYNSQLERGIHDCKGVITKCTAELKATTESYKYDITLDKNQTLNSIQECKNILISYSEELKSASESYKNEIEVNKSQLINSINQYNAEVSKNHDSKFEHYEKENSELKNQIYALGQNTKRQQNRLTWSLVVSFIASATAIVSIFI